MVDSVKPSSEAGQTLSVFKWKPSSEFDESLYSKKKNDLAQLVAIFTEAKNKRKEAKSADKTDQTENNAPDKKNTIFPTMGHEFEKNVMKRPKDLIFRPKSKFFAFSDSEETEDEIIQNMSISVKTETRTYFVPKRFDYAAVSVICDGFDIAPELIELLPKKDPQSQTLNRQSITRSNFKFKNLRKRKPVGLVVEGLTHDWSADYVPDSKISEDALKRRKKMRREFSCGAWRDIVVSEIKKAQNKQASQFERKIKLLGAFAECAISLLRRKYEIPSAKDIHSRARKIVYEMQTYWRKVDRESDDTKKKRTRDVITERKKFHSEKEVKRQSQRLDFLLRQTEIFSHFIGAKMGINLTPSRPKAENGPNSITEGELIAGDSTVATDDIKNGDINHQIDAKNNKKAAKAAMEFMNRRKNETKSYEKEIVSISGNKAYERTKNDDEKIDEMDLLNPSLMPEQTNIKEPDMFVGTLKSYQLKGLNWLVNLYDHSINGILADEMGLGKTIQSIAFIAHLCETENLWGPYLVVAPNSVVHNWCYEFEQFAPAIKVLPYWGQQKDREVLRRFWKSQFLYSSEGEFHVMVTSYSTFQTDERHFKKMKWQFIILDEAHAIKNSSSQRWKSLLSIECRNRLLLTGTPIQNSMAELWSLLHYIMPSIFTKHHDFKEWFSKNIEDHAEGKSQKLNSVQLRRLHMILKPFMLRRVKSDVEHEMAPKMEIVIKCDLSSRQRRLYNAIKRKFQKNLDCEEEGLAITERELYNAVMQFRKVCNHPEIYKIRIKKSPLCFKKEGRAIPLLSALPKDHVRELRFSGVSSIDVKAPRLVAATRSREFLADPLSHSERRRKLLQRLCVFDSDHVAEALRPGGGFSNFAFLRLLGLSVGEFEFLCKNGPLFRWLFFLGRKPPGGDGGNSGLVEHMQYLRSVPKFLVSAYLPKCLAPPISLSVSENEIEPTLSVDFEKAMWLKCAVNDINGLKSQWGRYARSFCFPSQATAVRNPFSFIKDGLFESFRAIFGTNRSIVERLPLNILLADCGKLTALDKLLKEKKENGHRVLIFSQMTKMLDILEDYCHYRLYKFLRLDGSTQITDRTLMVKQFQRDASVFIFLLSTRAGGLGINLTAADTVIFYDNDWNPTMDAQAMDRVHRIGQKKQVTVYRIICRNTVEERVWKVAQQKFRIQKSVYSGGFKFTKEKKKKGAETPDSKIFKVDQLRDMILDDRQ